jgi:hypothetical protein
MRRQSRHILFGRHRKRCLSGFDLHELGFDLHERYRNLPDLHVLRGSNEST